MKMKLRIAFRREGGFWNAYAALDEGMRGSFLIGSIGFAAAANHPEIKQAFMDLMKMTLSAALKDTTGKAAGEWTTRKAPESERGGSA